MKNQSGNYDVINLPHPVSKTHPQMARIDRAAQFAPFAALTGYEEAIKRTAQKKEAEIKEEEKGVQWVDV